MSTEPDYRTGNLAMRNYVAELEERVSLLRRVVKRLDEVGGSDYKRIQQLEAENQHLTEQCKRLAEVAMNNGQGLLLLERERDRLREAAQQALSFIDGTDLRTAPLARSTAQALRDALNKADTNPQEADNV